MAVNLSPTDYNFRVCTSSTRPTGVEGLLIYETDTNLFYYYDGSAWVTFGNKVLQVVNTQTGAVATGTTTIPYDDTIPQNTEGTQFMSLEITPKSASSYLLIQVVAWYSLSTGPSTTVGALFVDSTANALAACADVSVSAGYRMRFVFNHYVASGSTTARTYKLRMGGATAATLTFNGESGARRFGGVYASSITITEIAL